MGVRLVAEDEVEQAAAALRDLQPPLMRLPQGEPVPPAKPAAPSGPSREAAMMALIAMASRILGFRVQLFGAFLGSVWLSVYSVEQPGYIPLGVLALYNLMVLAPMIFLAYRRG